MYSKLIMVLATAILFILASQTSAQKTNSAQSIMAAFTTDSTITFTGTEILGFDRNSASGYFTNSVSSGPVISCSGNAANCDPSNQPSLFPPVPSEDALMRTTRANACVFLEGGQLQADSYTQSVSGDGLNGKGVWRFEWTYSITPIDVDDFPNPVAARTGWYVISSETDVQKADINGFIAALSGISSKQWARKYSFSLLDQEGFNRVTDVVLTVSGTGGTTSYPTVTTLRSNHPGALPGDTGAVDFLYVANGGTTGNSWVLPASTLPGGTGLEGRYILNSDSFLGNDNGGSDGEALSIAEFSFPQMQLEAGVNTLRLTGTVKGNGMLASTAFTVTYNIDVLANCKREWPD